MTEEGQMLLNQFINENPHAAVINICINKINFNSGYDRSIPAFYRETKWHEWVGVFLGEDNTRNRLLLREWTHESTQEPDNLYGFIQANVKKYMMKIQELLKGDIMYYARRQVNSWQSDHLATKGLNTIQKGTQNRYFFVWSDFVLMHVKLVHSYTEHLEEQTAIYRQFRQILCLNRDFLFGVDIFCNQMIDFMNQEDNDEVVLNVVHTFCKHIAFRLLETSNFLSRLLQFLLLSPKSIMNCAVPKMHITQNIHTVKLEKGKCGNEIGAPRHTEKL